MAGAGATMDDVRRLWTGRMPLARAFWIYAVLGGVAVNLVTSVLFVLLLLADRPIAAIIAGYGLSVPYNVVVTMGVWRAADRHDGERVHAELARFVTVIGMILLTAS